MPAIIPFIPLIASGVGAAATIYSGRQAERRNDQYLHQADRAVANQQQLIGELMAGITPDVYQAQAKQAGAAALDQMAASFAQRGMLSSGAHGNQAARTLSELYTNANAAYRQERQSALAQALGASQNLNNQFGQRINPNPYAGLGQVMAGLGGAAAYAQQHYTPTATAAQKGGLSFGVPGPSAMAYPFASAGGATNNPFFTARP